MARIEQIRWIASASRETLLTMLEALPDAFFVIDDGDMILYANERAQAMLGAATEVLCGHNFWCSAPYLVSPALYQAIRQTRRSGEPTAVEYRSAVTRTWLRASFSPLPEGLMVQFHQVSAPARRETPVSSSECLSIDDLNSLRTRFAIATPEGIVLDVNAVPLGHAHLRREEVIGKPLTEAPWWSGSPASQAQLRTAIARASTGETIQFETLLHSGGGSVFSFVGMIIPHLDADHHVVYLVIDGIERAARKQDDEAIHTVIDAIPHLVWIARPDGSITYNNQRLIDYLAMTHEQAEGAGWLEGVHPEDRPRVWEAWQTSIQTGEPYEVEYRMRDGISGAYRWFLVRGLPLRDAQGTILHWVGTCTDIEQQKRTEKQLNASRESWQILAETMPQLVWIEQTGGFVEYVNQRYIDYLQVRPEQLQSRGWSHFVHLDDVQGTLAAWRHACASGEPYEIEYRLKHGQTGAYRWFLVRALPLSDETGQITKWFGTCTDIEQQKRVEEALRQSQERVRALIDSNIIGIVSLEEEGHVVVEANEAWLRMTGYSREDVQSRTLTKTRITVPEAEPLFERAIQEVTARGQYMPFETEVVCKDGRHLPTLVGGAMFRDQPRQLVAFMLDNSARKELEERKDAFISMASHELRNPLTALKLQTSLLRRQLARQGALDQTPVLAGMERQIKTISRLVEELLDVSKIQAGGLEYIREPVDLDALLRDITETLQQTNPSHTLLVRGTVGTSLIGDRDRLRQVFTNLISNAIKYSPNAETVEMDLSTSEETVTVSVRDHGLGVPREQRDKIFDRFYRVTDHKQKRIPGLGMGLYIVAEIIKQHGGTITVESAVGKGSTFEVTLPMKRNN